VNIPKINYIRIASPTTMSFIDLFQDYSTLSILAIIFLSFISDSPISKVEANGLKDANNLNDTLSISLAFEKGMVLSESSF